MMIDQLVPYIIIFTYPLLIYIIVSLIKRSKKFVYLLDDKLLKSPIKLSTVLLAVALTFLLYSYIIHLILNTQGAKDYMWNLVGLLLSTSHLAKTKGAPYNYTFLYIFTMFIGLFVYGIFISNLVGYVKEKLKHLAKGRTKVIIEDHVLIIGKSKYMFPIIDQYIELAINIRKHGLDNLDQKNKFLKQKIVILSEDLPDNLMTEVEQKTAVLKRANYSAKMDKLYKKELQNKLIYRTGSTSSIHDLKMCNIQKAQSVILLGSDEEKIKSLLAISATDFNKNKESFVISKFDDTEMLNVAERNDFSDEYDLININSLIANLTARTTIQPNLSLIYNDLLDYNKCSIEFLKIKGDETLEYLIGKDFNYASNYLSNVALIGVKNGKIIINPAVEGDTIITENDELIIIKSPHIFINVNSQFENHINHDILNKNFTPFEKEDLNLVIIGFSENIYKLLDEFSNIVSPVSTVTVLCNDKYKKHINLDEIASRINVDFNVTFEFYSTFDYFKNKINELDSKNDIDSVIVLPNMFLNKEKRDDDSIFTLMDLKHLERENNRDYNITIDLSELSNHNLIENLDIADVIISDKIASELIFQFASKRDTKSVYEELLSIKGDEIYFNPIENYVTNMNEPISFYTLSEAALNKKEIAIGFKNHSGVSIISTDKSHSEMYKSGDFLIVISQGH